MATSRVVLLALAAFLFLTVPTNSQVYQQGVYGQGVYPPYPKGPMVVPSAPKSDITVFIIPLILIVLVIVCIPVLIASSSSTFEKVETTTKHPTNVSTERPKWYRS